MRTVLALALALSASSASAQTTWIVDDDGGAGFTDIQSAVDAASEGDSIYVKQGDYTSFTIDGKSLSVVGENVFTRLLAGAVVRVENLAAGQGVYVHNLRVFGPLAVEDCAGQVWFEGMLFGNGAPLVKNSDSVILVGTGMFGSVPAAGLRMENSTVYAYGLGLEGGSGQGATVIGSCGTFTLIPGTPALELVSSTLFLSDSTIQGGWGGHSFGDGVQFMGSGSDGGAAVSFLDANSRVTAIDTQFAGGTGGQASGGCSNGADGPVTIGPGTVSVLPGSARTVDVDSPVVENGTAALDFRGVAGDLVIAVIWTGPGLALDIAGITGPLVAGFPNTLVALGVLPASGVLNFTLGLGSTPPGTDLTTTYFQALFIAATSELYIGAPTGMTMLSAGL